jgi:hypothetical protein
LDRRVTEAERSAPAVADATWVARNVVRFVCALFERTGALMEKNAAETNRKV